MCRRRAILAGRACISVRGLLGARSQRLQSVEAPRRKVGKRQLIRPRESEAPGARAPWQWRRRVLSVGASAPLADGCPQRPTWRPAGSLPGEPICSAPAELSCPAQHPRPALARPSPFPLSDRDGRGLPPPPLAAPRGPLSCGA